MEGILDDDTRAGNHFLPAGEEAAFTAPLHEFKSDYGFFGFMSNLINSVSSFWVP